MGATRSPNYPNVPLADAIEFVRPVFKNEHRNKMPQKALAKHLGYNSLSGRALAKIGAIRAYGLIEGSGDQIRVSDDAITILTAPPERRDLKQQALEACALRSPLFKELRGDFPDQLPSLENLKFNLIQRGYTETASEKAAQNFLETMRLVLEFSGDNASEQDPEEGADIQRVRQTPPDPLPKRPLPPPSQGTQRAEFPLAEGVARLDFPASLSAESYEDLEAWIQLVLRRAKRSVKAEDSAKE